MFSVYILWSESLGKFYIGQTGQPVQTRLDDHNLGRVKWTSRGVPWTLAYTEVLDSRSAAMQRERQIKSWKSAKSIRQLMSDKN